MRRLPVVVAPLLAVSLVLAGCGGKDEKKPAADETVTATPTPTPTPEPITSPLTGEEVAKLPKHPVMIAKIDNTASSAPQVGLGKADLIVEELVEGGVTRLATFFHSKLPELAGPIRSMRASDIGIVAPIDGKIITSGAAAPTIQRIQQADIQFFQEGAKGTFRQPGRYAPYNLFSNPKEIGAKLAEPDELPDYLPFGDTSAQPQGKPASSLAASFGSRTTNWTFTDGGYENTNSYAAADDKFVPKTVLVLQVKITDAGYRDPAGSFVPESHLAGAGTAWMFTDGRMVKAKWKKAKPASPLTLVKGGQEIKVPVGKTFIELIPEGQGGVSFQR